MSKKKLQPLAEYNAYPLPVSDIFVDSDFNCRGLFTRQSVAELGQSLRDRGLDIPVTVRPITLYEQTSNYRWHLVTGHRRIEAAKAIGWETIPAVVRELDDRAARILNLQENIERQTLNILQEALAIQAIFPWGVTLERAAKELNRPTRWVHARLRLLKLPEQVQQLAATGLISAQNIDRIARIPDEEKQLAAALALVSDKQSESRNMGDSLAPELKDTFNVRRTKDQMLKGLVRVMDQNVIGFEAKALGWAAGYVSDDDFYRDLEANSLGARIARIEKHLGISDD